MNERRGAIPGVRHKTKRDIESAIKWAKGLDTFKINIEDTKNWGKKNRQSFSSLEGISQETVRYFCPSRRDEPENFFQETVHYGPRLFDGMLSIFIGEAGLLQIHHEGSGKNREQFQSAAKKLSAFHNDLMKEERRLAGNIPTSIISAEKAEASLYEALRDIIDIQEVIRLEDEWHHNEKGMKLPDLLGEAKRMQVV